MGKEFTDSDELELPADPEQVWQAIATGPGQDSWFLSRNQVGTGPGGEVRSDFAGGAVPPSVITGWEPGHRLAYASRPAEDGRFLASEYLIEGRGAGSTVLRIVTTGFLPGDDWETEYDAMRAGNCAFRSSLVEAVSHFPGRKPTPITLFGPVVPDWQVGWKRLDDALGLDGRIGRGSPVALQVPGLAPVTGEIYAANDQFRGVRTPDAMYRFIQGLPGMLLLSHVVFAGDVSEQPWQAWLDELFG